MLTSIVLMKLTILACAFLAIIAAGAEAFGSLNDASYWRSVAIRQGADGWDLPGMFRSYAHANQALDTAAAGCVFMLLFGMAGCLVCFL
jgi:hypothetical protein